MMENEPSAQDVVNGLAKVQVAFDILGLSWKHERVQKWVARAGAVYAKRFEEQGLTCPMPPPYRRLSMMPGSMVMALGTVLWNQVLDAQKRKEVQDANGSSGTVANEPAASGTAATAGNPE